MTSVAIDQADGLRALAGTAATATAPHMQMQRARTIAVASGKGGVGKTFVATNLAVLAARRGVRVLLVDGDLGLANVDTVLAARPRFTIEDVVDGRASIADAIVDGPSGAKILAAGSGSRSRALGRLDGGARQRIIDELAAVDDRFDVVVIDCGAGIGDNVIFFASAASTCVLTVNAEPTSLVDAYAAAKALSQVGVEAIDVVVNSAVSDADARDCFGRLAAVVGRFLPVRMRFAGGIPRDEAVREAVMSRRPLVEMQPKARAAMALSRLERQIVDAPDRRSRNDGGGRLTLWWNRMLRESAR